MEPFKADTFYKIGKILDNLASTHGLAWRLGSGFYGEPETVPALDEQISQANRTDLLVWVHAIAEQCRKIGLGRATEYADDILRQLDEHHDWKNRQIAILLRELDKH